MGTHFLSCSPPTSASGHPRFALTASTWLLCLGPEMQPGVKQAGGSGMTADVSPGTPIDLRFREREARDNRMFNLHTNRGLVMSCLQARHEHISNSCWRATWGLCRAPHMVSAPPFPTAPSCPCTHLNSTTPSLRMNCISSTSSPAYTHGQHCHSWLLVPGLPVPGMVLNS
jgi:hypothetical protein